MTSFFTHSELNSDEYRMLNGTESHRELFVVAASILGDLCDEIAGPHGLDEERFPNYVSFCEWVRDTPQTKSLTLHWLYYWDMAVYVLSVYEELPRMTDWELSEEVSQFCNSYEGIEIADVDKHFREQIIESCFALSRWIRGIPNEDFPPVFEVGHSASE
jgi:hypothetical protein